MITGNVNYSYSGENMQSKSQYRQMGSLIIITHSLCVWCHSSKNAAKEFPTFKLFILKNQSTSAVLPYTLWRVFGQILGQTCFKKIIFPPDDIKVCFQLVNINGPRRHSCKLAFIISHFSSGSIRCKKIFGYLFKAVMDASKYPVSLPSYLVLFCLPCKKNIDNLHY